MAAVLCQVGGRFSRCPNSSRFSCQYCGRSFCDVHSYWVEDHEAVCTRKQCRLKRDDLADHTAYRAEVTRRNRAGHCGLATCETPSVFECSLCEGHFCEDHLATRMYTFRDGWSRVDRPVSVCPHCWGRRKVWKHR